MPLPQLYGLDNCDSCRKARNWLKRADVEHRFTDYRAEPVAAPTLKVWAAAAGSWDSLINRASTTWRTLPDNRKSPGSDPEWTLLLKEYPALIKRPVIVMPDGAVHQGFSDNGFKKLFGTQP